MPWQLLLSPSDYVLQLYALLHDPVYRGIRVSTGKGEPVLLIPGFLAGDWTLSILAGWLNRMGYRPYFSGINWNVDCPNKTGEQLRWRLDYITKETGSSITVIGHSLGGMLGRFLGANFPEKIRHVIALGAPIDNSMRVHPLVLSASQLLQPFRRIRGQSSPACGSPQCACRFSQTVSAALPQSVGFTAIFTKEDEVVDWRSCIDPQGENRQVSGRHVGLIVNREVYRILADILTSYRLEKAEVREPVVCR